MNSIVPAPDVADGLRRADGDGADRCAQVRRHAGRGRFLDHFLVAALERAIALAEMNDVAVCVGEHLDLDVAGLGDVALDQHVRIAEARLSLALRAFQGGFEIVRPLDAAHALATAPCARLDQNGIADLRGFLGEGGCVLLVAVIAGDDRDAGLLHQRPWRHP